MKSPNISATAPPGISPSGTWTSARHLCSRDMQVDPVHEFLERLQGEETASGSYSNAVPRRRDPEGHRSCAAGRSESEQALVPADQLHDEGMGVIWCVGALHLTGVVLVIALPGAGRAGAVDAGRVPGRSGRTWRRLAWLVSFYQLLVADRVVTDGELEYSQEDQAAAA